MELKKAQYLFEQFFPEGEVKQLAQQTEGLINQTFVVSTAERQYVLQAINKAVFPDYAKGLENILLVKKYLEEAHFSYHFPTPIQDKYVEYESEVWRLFPFVEGSVCHQQLTDIEQALEAAQCLGVFYRCLQEFPVEDLHLTLPHFHDGAFRYSQFESALQIAAKDRKLAAKELIESIQKEKEVLLRFDVLNQSLPQRVVHFDTKISNFLFDNKTRKAKALIDLDTLMPGTVLSDIGDMIRTYSNRLGEESKALNQVVADPSVVEQIIHGFVSEALLTKREQQQLYFGGKAITLLQCVRFLTDYLNGDVYYQTTYEAHNWMRAQNQWVLYCSLKGQAPPSRHVSE